MCGFVPRVARQVKKVKKETAPKKAKAAKKPAAEKKAASKKKATKKTVAPAAPAQVAEPFVTRSGRKSTKPV
ncbi:hypothetical protein CAEBREN_01005 [Caenorhabditis brenneri]|uniref:Uncharacterized protein n=1 Tax=Caenorhabditis brenneri TaxID=135651 RepID=G0P3N8_CAEBE|nr:hypothetical protein CAEBREN_01005 [Caenorhabditis brenneri]